MIPDQLMLANGACCYCHGLTLEPRLPGVLKWSEESLRYFTRTWVISWILRVAILENTTPSPLTLQQKGRESDEGHVSAEFCALPQCKAAEALTSRGSRCSSFQR